MKRHEDSVNNCIMMKKKTLSVDSFGGRHGVMVKSHDRTVLQLLKLYNWHRSVHTDPLLVTSWLSVCCDSARRQDVKTAVSLRWPPLWEPLSAAPSLSERSPQQRAGSVSSSRGSGVRAAAAAAARPPVPW